MIVLLTSNQNHALRRPQKGRANLSRKEKNPGYSHTAGVFARTHTHTHYADACGWEQVKRSTL
jgi:hypothetical protein